MPSSYQKRIIENNELMRKNKLLQEELDKMRNAIAILNNSIFRMERITGENNLDLELRFEELCKEMEEDKNN
jgi:hypothetical protein